jgi:hypothetical protein
MRWWKIPENNFPIKKSFIHVKRDHLLRIQKEEKQIVYVKHMKFFIALIEYFIHIYEQVEMRRNVKIYVNQKMKDETQR